MYLQYCKKSISTVYNKVDIKKLIKMFLVKFYSIASDDLLLADQMVLLS
jgi:hypothetical protein